MGLDMDMVAHAFSLRQKQVDLFEFETSVGYTQRKWNLMKCKYCKDLIYTIIPLKEERFLRLGV